mmetsp:Transcript_15217/g.31916  ORF Transcript_15217/g.31916 Transcript_15217/m.31916 type:complete len:116 (-) Transcript_15217:711-1058(-)
MGCTDGSSLNSLRSLDGAHLHIIGGLEGLCPGANRSLAYPATEVDGAVSDLQAVAMGHTARYPSANQASGGTSGYPNTSAKGATHGRAHGQREAEGEGHNRSTADGATGSAEGET